MDAASDDGSESSDSDGYGSEDGNDYDSEEDDEDYHTYGNKIRKLI